MSGRVLFGELGAFLSELARFTGEFDDMADDDCDWCSFRMSKKQAMDLRDDIAALNALVESACADGRITMNQARALRARF